MNKNIQILKLLLLAGSIYFLLVAIFHLIGFKIPPFFIYYNVPSYVYQDRIISFLSFGWSIFLFTAFLNPILNKMLIRAILVAGAGAIIGLEIINAYTNFESISNIIDPTIFRLETLGLVVYLVLLTIYYIKSKNN
ncbi:MAG: hypothetical protein GWP19_15805 [Planctomycetia bacterium]|nr:hypothetical protein [Planctomycetia bacterium]